MPDSIPMILVSSHFQKIKPISNFNSEKLFLMVDLDRCIHCGVCGIGCAMEKEENYPRTIFFTKKHPKQNTVTAPIHLPCSCRYCLTPCTYYDFYNFSISFKSCSFFKFIIITPRWFRPISRLPQFFYFVACQNPYQLT